MFVLDRPAVQSRKKTSAKTKSFGPLSLHGIFEKAAAKPVSFTKAELINIRNALQADAFKSKVLFEPIFGRDKILAHEALARPEGNGQAFPIQILANQMYNFGYSSQLDTLTSLNALHQTRKFPITLNISVESALSEKFWDLLIPRIARYSPRDVIFEILEHNVDLSADTMVIEALRGAGYRFALDDFGLGAMHNRRLQVFGPIMDFIKIDGYYLQDLYVHNPDNLKSLVKYLRSSYPQAQLIAEHVKHFDQAQILFALGFCGVQGRNLRVSDFKR